MDKRFLYFIVLSAAILYGFNYFYAAKNQSRPAITASSSSKMETTSLGNDLAPQKDKQPAMIKPETIRTFKLKNQQMEVVFSSLGGTLQHVWINKYRKHENTREKLDMLEQAENAGYLALQLVADTKPADLSNRIWNVQEVSNRLLFDLEAQPGLHITKAISFHEDTYSGKLQIDVRNQSSKEINLEQINLVWGPVRSDGKALKEAVVLNVRKIDRVKAQKRDQRKNYPITQGWAALRDQYFCAAFYTPSGAMSSADIIQGIDQSLRLNLFFIPGKLKAGESKTYVLEFYWGPQNYSLLRKSGYSLEKVIDFGMFWFISVPLLYLLNFFYQVTHNYGLAIIMLTIIIRAILWWPTQRSYTSMKKMQTAMSKMQPRLKTLKEIYKDNPQKLNEETVKLYKEYQINPLGGCLPMLLQMPVFFALYATLSSAVELKGAEFLWVWKDLSAKDPVYVLPIAMGISMFVQQKISTPPAATPEAAAQQKMMLYMLPAMLTFFSFMWPSGLLLYWVVSNVLSIAQQWIINRKA